jgi:hypothetical protein
MTAGAGFLAGLFSEPFMKWENAGFSMILKKIQKKRFSVVDGKPGAGILLQTFAGHTAPNEFGWCRKGRSFAIEWVSFFGRSS